MSSDSSILWYDSGSDSCGTDYAVGALQGDTTGPILSIGDLLKEPIIKVFEQSGVKLPELIPGPAQLYSGALVARDVWYAAGEFAECF
jgi:hypothetical protein